MDKTALKTRLLELAQSDYEDARAKYQSTVADARVARGETVERSEQSQAEAAGELAAALDEAMHDDEARLTRLSEIDFAARDTVGEGAAVHLDDRLLVVCVSTSEFDFDGLRTMGISPAAPIYKAMADLGAGDSFTFNGTEHEIKGVY
ncbi:hypothetical protein PGB28_12555 [Primorskyibacter aestuariivivens]|uniref:hypothetical protein n=1 Tax=Primorskyibacter aestuariivivens TaxID=1888912 RepID=UPI002301E306|nr:hypothetical protein [Primorskyibacter aestuariivivens]MDA7429294.1 hypothetical protein [Primorskyibacter aestuariivivens]